MEYSDPKLDQISNDKIIFIEIWYKLSTMLYHQSLVMMKVPRLNAS